MEFFKNLFFTKKFECVVCAEAVLEWKSYGTPSRPGLCPHCGAKPRHREMILFIRGLQKKGLLNNESRILEIGPSKITCRKVMTPEVLEGVRYNVVDVRYLPHHSIVQKNGYNYKQASATELPFLDDYFDLVICNQVLPYIEDDIKALAEMRRVLKPTGIAILNSHTESVEKTVTIAERQKVEPQKYTQAFIEENGTAWEYGQDYIERIRAGGFKVEARDIVSYLNLSDSDIQKYGFKNHSLWYFANK